MARDYIEQRDGNYYVAGTRISLDSLVHAFRRGESAETICENFELLDLEEVYGAIAYYLANQAAIDAYLGRVHTTQKCPESGVLTRRNGRNGVILTGAGAETTALTRLDPNSQPKVVPTLALFAHFGLV